MMREMDDPGADFVRDLDREQLEALVETMYLVAFADGEYGPEERAHFEQCVAMLSGGRLRGDDFDHLIERLSTTLAARGRDGVILSLKRRLNAHGGGTTRLSQVALILAIDMASADGVLHPNERSFIEALGTSLGVEPSTCREVIDGPRVVSA
jgi:tellurite resistance protein